MLTHTVSRRRVVERRCAGRLAPLLAEGGFLRDNRAALAVIAPVLCVSGASIVWGHTLGARERPNTHCWEVGGVHPQEICARAALLLALPRNERNPYLG